MVALSCTTLPTFLFAVGMLSHHQPFVRACAMNIHRANVGLVEAFDLTCAFFATSKEPVGKGRNIHYFPYTLETIRAYERAIHTQDMIRVKRHKRLITDTKNVDFIVYSQFSPMRALIAYH